MTLYLFFDEGGNLDFSPKGSPWFSLTCVAQCRPFHLHGALDARKHDYLEYGLEMEHFHCADDNTHVRKKVFGAIENHLKDLRINALLVEKRKTEPALRSDQRFYPEMLGRLLCFVMAHSDRERDEEVIVITDTLPLKRKRQAVEKAVRMTLKKMLPPDCRYRVLHHASKSHFGLQVADYCNWAILRRKMRGETEQYDRIKPAIASEFEIFQNGKIR